MRRGREREPLALNGTWDFVMRLHAGLITLAIGALFGWVVQTQSQVDLNAQEIERQRGTVAEIGGMKTGLEVLKDRQARQTEDLQEIKAAVKAIVEEIKAK